MEPFKPDRLSWVRPDIHWDWHVCSPARPLNFKFLDWSDQKLVPFGPGQFFSVRADVHAYKYPFSTSPPNFNFPAWSYQKLVSVGPGRFYSVRSDDHWNGHPFPHQSTKFQPPTSIHISNAYRYAWRPQSYSKRAAVKYKTNLAHPLVTNGVHDKTCDSSPQNPSMNLCQTFIESLSRLCLAYTLEF
jgi:hypothetical protein